MKCDIAGLVMGLFKRAPQPFQLTGSFGILTSCGGLTHKRAVTPWLPNKVEIASRWWLQLIFNHPAKILVLWWQPLPKQNFAQVIKAPMSDQYPCFKGSPWHLKTWQPLESAAECHGAHDHNIEDSCFETVLWLVICCAKYLAMFCGLEGAWQNHYFHIPRWAVETGDLAALWMGFHS